MKAYWRIAIVTVLCLAMLTGMTACAGNSTGETPAASNQPAQSSKAEEKPADNTTLAEKIQLTFSLWGDPSEKEATQKALDVFNDMQDRINVTALQISYDEYNASLQTMAAAGNMPDCGMVAENTVIGWAKSGLLSDYDIYADVENKPLDYLGFKYDGKTVAYSAANEVLALWYNKDMFDAAGIAYPPVTKDTAWTWDEFVSVAKQLTFDANGNTPNDAGFDKNNIKQYGAYVNHFTWQLQVWALSNGGRFFSQDGKSVVFDDAAIEAVQKVFDLHLVEGIAPFNPGTNDDGFASSLGAGNVAMCTEGQWATGFRGAGFDVNYGVAVLPYMQKQANIATGGPVGVFSTTQYQEEVGEFLRWYTDAENNFSLIEAGWWMPTTMDWYTDSAKIDRWVYQNELRKALPAEAYKTAIFDVALDLSVTESTAWYYAPNNYEVLDLTLGPALVEAINGSKTVKDVVEANRAAMQAALER